MSKSQGESRKVLRKPCSDSTEAINEVVAYLKANLRLDVKTTSEYTGATDGPAYKDCMTIQLVFADEVISEVYL